MLSQINGLWKSLQNISSLITGCCLKKIIFADMTKPQKCFLIPNRHQTFLLFYCFWLSTDVYHTVCEQYDLLYVEIKPAISTKCLDTVENVTAYVLTHSNEIYLYIYFPCKITHKVSPSYRGDCFSVNLFLYLFFIKNNAGLELMVEPW